MKPCRKCGVSKPLSEFHKAAGMRDGHRNECKLCWSEIQRTRYQRDRDNRIRAAQEWRRQLDRLSSEFTVVAWDDCRKQCASFTRTVIYFM